MKKTLSIALIALVCLTACKKAKDGAPGATGKTGNANVQAFTFTTNSSNWIPDNTNNIYYYDYTLSSITSSVLSGGAVMTYLGDGTGNYWQAMPFTIVGVEYNYVITPKSIEIDVTMANGTMPANPGGQQFKVVVIPPAVQIANPNIDYRNYTEVKEKFNL